MTRRLFRLCLVAVVWSPAVVPLWLIARFGVDVPYWDEWEFVGLVVDPRGVSLARLFAQHNEHRMFFPRLLHFVDARLAGWDLTYLMYASWCVTLATSVAVWRLASRTPDQRSWLAMFAANLLLFCGVQAMNWTYAIQIGVFLVNAGTVIAIVIAASSVAEGRKLAWCAMACTVASLSMANGLASWIVVYPVLIAAPTVGARQRHAALVVFPILFGLTVAAYFFGYHTPAGQPSALAGLRTPLDTLRFWLVFLGAPLTPATPVSRTIVATGIGAALIAVFSFLVWRVLRAGDRSLTTRAMPWLMVAGFVLLSAALAAAGRVRIGLSEALALRYATLPLVLVVSLIFLGVVVRDDAAARQSRRSGIFDAAVTAGVLGSCVLAVLSTLAGVGYARLLSSFHKAEKTAVTFVRFASQTDFGTSYVLPLAEYRTRVELLDRAGLLRPRMATNDDVRSIEHGTGADDSQASCGAVELTLGGFGRSLHVEGWAVLPWSRRPADAVLLAVDTPDGRSTMFAVARVGDSRSDVATTLGDAFLYSGWKRVLTSAEAFRAGSGLSAWAYDLGTGTSCRLETGRTPRR